MLLAVRTSPVTSIHHHQQHPMADYRRLACPSCGKSYKYRGGLLRHIGECFTDDLVNNDAVPVPTVPTSSPSNPVTPMDVRVLSKFWKN